MIKYKIKYILKALEYKYTNKEIGEGIKRKNLIQKLTNRKTKDISNKISWNKEVIYQLLKDGYIILNFQQVM